MKTGKRTLQLLTNVLRAQDYIETLRFFLGSGRPYVTQPRQDSSTQMLYHNSPSLLSVYYTLSGVYINNSISLHVCSC